MPYTFKHQGKQYFSFRPDLSFFLNGIFLGYSELKSNWNNQNAKTNGRKKVAKDYLSAVQEYLQIADGNDLSQSIKKDFLKIFEKAIHITSTDINETYVIRNISNQFEEIKATVATGDYDFENYNKKVLKEKTDLALADYLLEKEGVAVVPGSAFGSDGYFRISFATSMENLIEAMKRIKRALSV